MEHFLAERYVARADVAQEAALLRALADDAHVRLLQTVYVPDDEVCFFLFEGDSREAVAELAQFDRVSEAVAQ